MDASFGIRQLHTRSATLMNIFRKQPDRLLVVEADGYRLRAAVVSIAGKDVQEFARGVVNYSSAEIRKIRGMKTNQIKDDIWKGYAICSKCGQKDKWIDGGDGV